MFNIKMMMVPIGLGGLAVTGVVIANADPEDILSTITRYVSNDRTTVVDQDSIDNIARESADRTRLDSVVVREPTQPGDVIVKEPTNPDIPVVTEPKNPDIPIVTEPKNPDAPTNPDNPVVTEPKNPDNPVVTEPKNPDAPTNPDNPPVVVTEPTNPDNAPVVVTEPTNPDNPPVVVTPPVDPQTPPVVTPTSGWTPTYDADHAEQLAGLQPLWQTWHLPDTSFTNGDVTLTGDDYVSTFLWGGTNNLFVVDNAADAADVAKVDVYDQLQLIPGMFTNVYSDVGGKVTDLLHTPFGTMDLSWLAPAAEELLAVLKDSGFYTVLDTGVASEAPGHLADVLSDFAATL